MPPSKCMGGLHPEKDSRPQLWMKCKPERQCPMMICLCCVATICLGPQQCWTIMQQHQCIIDWGWWGLIHLGTSTVDVLKKFLCNRQVGVVIGWTAVSSGTSHCWDHVLMRSCCADGLMSPLWLDDHFLFALDAILM